MSNSKVDGQAIRLRTNHECLTQAATLGFRDIHLYAPEAPALCRDEYRSYDWASLGKYGAVKSATTHVSE